MNQEFRSKKMDEIRNYLIEETNHELMSKKHEKVCRILNYIEHSLILISTITGCVSIPAFASLVGVSIGITCYAITLEIFVITVGIKKYKALNKKNKKKHEKIISLAKSESNIIEVLVSYLIVILYVILLFKMQKKYRKQKSKSCKK